MSVLFILILNFSCSQKKTSLNGALKSEVLNTSKKDTLKFTSGIRAIFQDSKGNYWFGSLQEGVAVYNGKSFAYYTNDDGLTDNQIHSIQEDKEGIIWFNTLMGVSSYDGERIKNRIKADLDRSQNILPTKTDTPVQGEWIKSDNDLWFEAGIQEGVYRFDGQKLNYLAFPPP